MKTNSNNPGKDLQTIREIMERSSKFLSLSGLSGIFAGVCALIGVGVAWFFILDAGQVDWDPDTMAGFTTGIPLYIGLDALFVLGFAMLGAFYFSLRNAKKAGLSFWTNSTQRLLIHLLIPLITGGIFILLLLFRHNWELIPACMLIFYGLSLVYAGKFTLGEIHYLGLTEIGLGILAGLFIRQSLLFWTIGFGVMHIIYGAVMFYRHER